MQMIKIGTVILTALLALGCKRNPDAAVEDTTNAAPAVTTNDVPAGTTNAAPAGTNAPAVSVPSRTRDLGVVVLTNHYETRIQLGEGKSCAITPLLLANKQLQLTMVLESKMADGKTRGLNIMKVTTRPAEQFEVDFGSLALTLIPQLAGE